MAFYRPDFKLEEAKKLLESLDNSEENELIKYYIQVQKSTIEEQNKKLAEYYNWFKKLDEFLPNRNPVLG